MKPEKQTVSALKRKCNKLFSEYIRRKYSDENGMCTCFTCNKRMDWREMQVGHGISGRGNFVLYLEEVCRPQDYSCNVGRQGRYDVFVPKLIELYGVDQYQEWVIESRKPLKRTKADYVALVYELQARLADLEV